MRRVLAKLGGRLRFTDRHVSACIKRSQRVPMLFSKIVDREARWFRKPKIGSPT